MYYSVASAGCDVLLLPLAIFICVLPTISLVVAAKKNRK
jgi:hypothetical protein